MSHNVEPSAKGGLSWKVDFVNPYLWVPTHKRCGDAQSALRRSLYKMANPGLSDPNIQTNHCKCGLRRSAKPALTYVLKVAVSAGPAQGAKHS